MKTETHLINILIFFVLTASIGILFSKETVAVQQLFFLYYFAQCILYGFAFLIRIESNHYIYGAALGIGFTTAAESIWELCFHKGPNSLPTFPFIFMAIPAIFAGLFITGSILHNNIITNVKIKFALPFLLTSPFGWYCLYISIFN